MIRIPLLITFLCLLAGAVMADEMNISNNSTQTGNQTFMNLTFNSNATDAFNLTSAGDQTLSNMTSGENITNSKKMVAAEETPAKPVYKQSIGSVYPPDFKEPEPRVFTSSGCGA
ncbi:MAG: hypothetical protein V1862_13170 [Methanobacteriota archaeon]